MEKTAPIMQVILVKSNHTNRLSSSENPIVEVSSSYLQKRGISHFSQKKDDASVSVSFFFRVDRIELMVLEDRERAYSYGS